MEGKGGRKAPEKVNMLCHGVTETYDATSAVPQ